MLKSALAAALAAGLMAPAAALPIFGPLCAASAAAILGLPMYPWTGSVSSNNLAVNLGYGIYNGTHNATSNVRSWKGVPYAKPPVGNLRWQKPRPPAYDSSGTVHQATSYGPQCPQTPPAVPYFAFEEGNEDCLYINVYAPDSTSGALLGPKKPVLVWIHGGGYGMGDGANDLTDFLNANNNEFVAITIQYRLGAFGYLSSADVAAHGVLNAGLLDQAFALLWVQNYISLFGGDPSRVTIAGESSGGGSVMYHALARGGDQRLHLFRNAIAASPYLIPQHAYDGAVPTARYDDFAAAAGCGGLSGDAAVWDCLVAADSLALQYASSNVSAGLAQYATWAFVPVTDGSFIQRLPTEQLAAGDVLGTNIMVGNNADEGALFVAGGISDDAALSSWIATTFPGLDATNRSALVAAYADGPDGANYSYPLDGPKFETDGTNWPTASDVSMAATGPQQRAYNMYGEGTFVCTAYFLADAFTQPGHSAFQYQYSVPFASHGADLGAYLGPPTDNQSPDFVRAMRQIWGGFIVRDDPSILDSSSQPDGLTAYPVPAWTSASHQLVSLNTTGGVPVEVTEVYGGTGIEYVEPGLSRAFKTADADAWEGGRWDRCEFWRSVGPYLPK